MIRQIKFVGDVANLGQNLEGTIAAAAASTAGVEWRAAAGMVGVLRIGVGVERVPAVEGWAAEVGKKKG